VVLELSAQTRDAFLGVEEVLHRGVAEDDYHVGPCDVDFAQEEGLACARLFGRGRSVAGRSAAVDVADENVLALHADGLYDLVEELPGSTDEGPARSVLVSARGLADEQKSRFGIALRVDDCVAALMERAADAVAYVGAYVLEGFAGLA